MTSKISRAKQAGPALLCVAATLVALAFSASPASAHINHGYLKEITGVNPVALAVGPDAAEPAAEPSALFVGGGGEVQRLSAAGVPLPFECVAEHTCPQGVEGNKLRASSATGTGTLTKIVAGGTGTLSAGTRLGSFTSGSKEVVLLPGGDFPGAFAVGQQVFAAWVPAGTTITAITTSPAIESVTLSAAATETKSEVEFAAGSTEVTDVTTTTGVFTVGEELDGSGIEPGTTITVVGSGAHAGTLQLSKAPTIGGGEVAITVGGKEVTGVASATGAFSVGQEISAPGLLAGTVIDKVKAGGVLELSQGAIASESTSLTASQSFGDVDGVAVDDATGDVYVADGRAHVVDVFAASGKFLSQIVGTCVKDEESAVEPGACSASKVVPFSGGGYERNSEPGGLVVDQATQQLYVADDGVVDKFTVEADGGAEYLSGIGRGVLPAYYYFPQTLAINESLVETGDVYVSANSSGGSSVDTFGPLGELAGSWEGAETPNKSFYKRKGADGPLFVGGDALTGHVFVASEPQNVVDEEGSSPSEDYLDRITGITNSEGKEVAFPGEEPLVSVTADSLTGDVYVGSRDGVVYVFTGDLIIPDVNTGAASEVKPEAAMLNGTTNPLQSETGEPADCSFVWGTSEALGETAQCAQNPETGSSSVPVSAELKELLPDTKYFYRLQASNAKGTNFSEEATAECEGRKTVDACFTTAGAGISEEAASDVAATSATLNAVIDPNKAPTSYHFEYDTTAYTKGEAPHGTSVPVPNVPIGSGEAPVEANPEHIQGLTPGAVYHFRVVAESEIDGKIEDFDGADATFKTQTAAGGFALPDGRQWEMVSPPQKNGALIEIKHEEAGVIDEAAAGGGAIAYMANIPTDIEVPGFAGFQELISTRGPDGWVTRELSQAHLSGTGQSVGEGQEYRFFSEDLSQAIVQPFGGFVPCYSNQGVAQPCLSPHASEQTAFLHADYLNGDIGEPCTSSCYRPLVTGCPAAPAHCEPAVEEYANVPEGTNFSEGLRCPPYLICGPFFVGATPDASHVVLSVKGNLEEWAGGKLTFIGPGFFGNEGGIHVHSVPAGESTRNAISRDGSRVFWSNGNGLYLHDMAKEASFPIAEVAAQEGFQIASSDGSRVLFTSNKNLYECEIVEGAGGKLECKEAEIAAGTGQYAVVGISEEGCDVSSGKECDIYYVGAGDNLYVRRDGVTSLIAALSPKDARVDGEVNDLSGRSSRVSPDGRWLAFMSERDLTGYDNSDAFSGRPDQEVYLYDAQTGRLACASCNPTGARPVGIENSGEQSGTIYNDGNFREFEQNTWLSGYLPAWTQYHLALSLYQQRYLSDSGRLFFNSDDALVPRDVNGTWDVYEYEPEGVGSETARCGPGSASGSEVFKPASSFAVEGREGETGAGCVGLISSGTSAQESAFVDASETGSEVFFLTASKLAPQDVDQNYDIYDARECTSASPCIAPPPLAPPQCTTADACRAAPTPQPAIFGAPSSATFSGVGNLTPPPPPAVVKPKPKAKTVKCKKGFVKKHDKCVKKPKRKSKAKKSGRDRRAR